MDSHNPYVGLRPFNTDESLLFFGRNEQTLELLQRLHSNHFVAVIGSSGSGKSSLLRAGLIPALKAGYLVDDSDHWFISIMKPGENPLFNLAQNILNQINENVFSGEVIDFVNQIKEEGADAIINKLKPLRKKENINFFLLVDQFEELFRFAMEKKDIAKKDEAIDFVNIILELTTQAEIPFYLVLTMRSDFIGDCVQFTGLPEAFNKSLFLVPKLSRTELKHIIEAPAKLYGCKINPALTSLLLNDLGKVKDELPILQHLLMRMWDYEMDKDHSGEIDVNDYLAVGGIDSALSNHADEALKELKEDDVQVCQFMFQALTTIDENGRKIRRPELLSKLVEITHSTKEKILFIIDLFIKDKRSFVVMSPSSVDNDYMVDISHESLIRQWNLLNQWVDEEAEAADGYIQLANASLMHAQNRKDLLSGSELQLALNWRNKYNPTAVWANRYKPGFEDCVVYLSESEVERERISKLRKIRKRNQWIYAFIAIGLLTVTAVVFIWGYIKIGKESAKAEASEKMAKSNFETAFRNLTIVDSQRIAQLKERSVLFDDYQEHELAKQERDSAGKIYHYRLDNIKESIWAREYYKSSLKKIMSSLEHLNAQKAKIEK